MCTSIIVCRAKKLPMIVLIAILCVSLSPAAFGYRLIQQSAGPGTYTAGNLVALGSGTTVRWIPRTVNFVVNNTGAGDGLTFANTNAAVTAAYDAWENVSCAAIAFTSLGGTAATRNPTDGNNTTYWAESGATEYAGPTAILGAGTLAVTILTIRADQTLTDVDIAFNGRDFNWALSDSATASDIQDTATHEIGHMLGFHHTDITGTPVPTMFAFDQSGNASRSLEGDDENALCYLYQRLSGASSTAAGDFDGNGFDDLAIGVPNEAIGTREGAGAVNTIYGTSGGLDSNGDKIWHQRVNNIGGTAERNDHLGATVVAGDFNGDGFDDVAVGVRGEDIGSIVRAGAVNIFYGTATGLDASGDQVWHQGTSGVRGTVEEDDQFGSALAAGDFNRDGFDDLAIGVPHEAIGSIAGAGAVNVLMGSDLGLTSTGDQMWHQAVSGIRGTAEQNDNFGAALTTGDFNDDGFDDLAVGVPMEDVGAVPDTGAVNVLFGSASGLSANNDQMWHQGSGIASGLVEADDNFGGALVSGDFNGDGFDDLAIGSPTEGIGNIQSAGAVHVLSGGGNGLTATNSQFWHQDSAGIDGQAEANDNFGSALSSGDYNNDGMSDLAIGVPSESIGSLLGAGAVNVIFGSSSGLTSTNDQIWHQDVSGVNGGSEADDRFGSALVSGNFDGSAFSSLAIGVPSESVDGRAGAGAVNVLLGSSSGLSSTGDQIWHQGSPGIAGTRENNDGFGGSL